jgi:uncharacterized protein YlxW (UPF0749 family)
MAYVILTLGVLLIAAAWDAWRRHVVARAYNLATLDRITKQEQELEKLHQQVQNVLGKLNAATAATANRIPRAIGR